MSQRNRQSSVWKLPEKSLIDHICMQCAIENKREIFRNFGKVVFSMTVPVAEAIIKAWSAGIPIKKWPQSCFFSDNWAALSPEAKLSLVTLLINGKIVNNAGMLNLQNMCCIFT